jgi:hypothetical protein
VSFEKDSFAEVRAFPAASLGLADERAALLLFTPQLSWVGCMNPEFEVLGIGRTPMSSEEFRRGTGEAVANSKDARDLPR